MERQYREKKRGMAVRNRRSVVFIAAEGRNRTERNYFHGLAADHKGIALKFAPGTDTDPEKLARGLARFMDESGFSYKEGDAAYCLVDHDCNFKKDEQIQKALAIARKKGFDLIVSNPCFEVWFICHFRMPGNYSSSSECIRDLEKYIAHYAKGDEDLYARTRGNILKALEMAEQLEDLCRRRGHTLHRHDFSPSTEVYRIVKEMLKRGDSFC